MGSAYEEPAAYACVSSKGGTVSVLNISNVSAELVQLSGMDTKAEVIGVFKDSHQH